MKGNESSLTSQHSPHECRDGSQNGLVVYHIAAHLFATFFPNIVHALCTSQYKNHIIVKKDHRRMHCNTMSSFRVKMDAPRNHL